MPPIDRPRLTAHNETAYRALFPPLAALLLLIGLLLWLVSVLVSAADRVQHSDAIIAKANEVLTLMVDAETGHRGYLVSGAPLFLEPYQKARKALPKAFDTLERLVADSSEQTERVRTLRTSYAQRATDAREVIELRRRDDPAWLTRFNSARGKQLMDTVRQQVSEVISAETALLGRRESQVHAATRNTFIGGGIGAVLLSILLIWTTRRQMRALSAQYEGVLNEEQGARNQALQERGRFLATLTSIGDGVLVTDAEGRITLLNPITERLTGWTQHEAIGKDSKAVFDIVHEETGAIVSCPVDEVIRDKKIVLLANHTLLRHRNGTTVVIEDSAAPVHDVEGALAGVVLVFRDVTERKEREQQIRANAVQQRRLIREMLASVTDGRLLLVDTENELPTLAAPWSEEVILTDTTLRLLRSQVRSAAEAIGLSDERNHDLLTAVGEASMNAVRHAGGGIGQIYTDPLRSLIQVRIRDNGTGIRETDLHRATLEIGWSGTNSLGHGFFLMLRSADRTYLLTGAHGTTIVLEQEQTAPQPQWLQTVGD